VAHILIKDSAIPENGTEKMNTLPVILACGPNIPASFIYGFFVTAGLVLFSFIWGLVSLFTGSFKLGIGLISFSAFAVMAFLTVIGHL
jgi:hypothetical protein